MKRSLTIAVGLGLMAASPAMAADKGSIYGPTIEEALVTVDQASMEESSFRVINNQPRLQHAVIRYVTQSRREPVPLIHVAMIDLGESERWSLDVSRFRSSFTVTEHERWRLAYRDDFNDSALGMTWTLRFGAQNWT